MPQDWFSSNAPKDWFTANAPNDANAAILAQQAAKYPTAAEQGGKPGSVAPSSRFDVPTLGSSLLEGLSKLGHILYTGPAPEANTGPSPIAIHGLSIPGLGIAQDALASGVLSGPGGPATEGLSLAEGIKSSPAANIVQGIKDLIPTTTKAGAKFEQIAAATNQVPVDTTAAEQVLERAKEMSKHGGSPLPRVMKKLDTALQPSDQPFSNVLTYKETKDFADAAGAQSVKALNAQNKAMQRQVGQFAEALKTANRDAAAQVGMGDIYDAAMKEYRQAMTLKEASDVLKKWAPRVAIRALQGLTVGAGAAAGYNLYEQLKR
jgi:hypothetical protein